MPVVIDCPAAFDPPMSMQPTFDACGTSSYTDKYFKGWIVYEDSSQFPSSCEQGGGTWKVTFTNAPLTQYAYLYVCAYEENDCSGDPLECSGYVPIRIVQTGGQNCNCGYAEAAAKLAASKSSSKK